MANATLCFSGFPRDQLAPILEQFEQASRELGSSWILAPESDADVLVIDMDSMYGHMSWLKAHGNGKTTIGLTAGDRSETDYLLKRPVSIEGLVSVLEQIVIAPRASGSEPSLPTESQAGPSANYLAAVTTSRMTAAPTLVPHQPHVSDFMSANALGGPAKLELPGAPVLAFDPASQTYTGSSQLKLLLPYVDAVISESDVIAIDTEAFDRIKASTGGAHPYMRLLWLCGLASSAEALLPGHSQSSKYVLTKWPQIEREFPKHFRIATVMMKGPALIGEITELAGVAQSEVIGFVNAGLVTGSVVVEGKPTAAGNVARAVALLALPRAG